MSGDVKDSKGRTIYLAKGKSTMEVCGITVEKVDGFLKAGELERIGAAGRARNAENWNNLFFQEERRKEMQRRAEAKAGIEALKREEAERQRDWNKRNPWTEPTKREEK
jgi:hypothetical protein